MIKSKKADTATIETSIFIFLNVIFMLLLLFFVYNSRNGAIVYEELYAKQIALIIDNAEPGMVIGYDITAALQKAEKNEVDKNKIIKISGNNVVVSLSDKGGKSFSFFSDYNVETKIVDKVLEIKVNNKNE